MSSAAKKIGTVVSPVAAISGGALKGLFGTDKGTIDTHATNSPWAGVQPYLLDLFQRGQGAVNTPSPLAAQASNAVGGMLSPEFLNPSSNPAFAGAVSDAIGQAKSAFAGQYGGPAGQNLGNSGYQEALARGLGSVATNAYADQYNKNLSAQLGAISAAPGVEASASPFANLERYKSLLAAGLPFSQSTNQQPYYQNKTAQTLGIAATVAPFLLSDVRAKENIERIGTHDTGIGIYKYQYKGDSAPQIGVLAQEVEQVKPEAVAEVGGLKMVNYRMI